MGAGKARVGRRRSTSWEHISDVAIDLFMERGFDDVSVDDVIAAFKTYKPVDKVYEIDWSTLSK